MLSIWCVCVYLSQYLIHVRLLHNLFLNKQGTSKCARKNRHSAHRQNDGLDELLTSFYCCFYQTVIALYVCSITVKISHYSVPAQEKLLTREEPFYICLHCNNYRYEMLLFGSYSSCFPATRLYLHFLIYFLPL